MAKLPCNIVMVRFSFILVTLMMCGAVQGQEVCHDVLPAPGGGQCDPQSCKDKCASKHGGTGLCVQDFENLYSCQCSWPCGKR
ncbi:hypothetical protein QUC31_010440 [Theobroma cacao]|uniref:Defensin-like protein 125 n=2 Tax=Theobroma cacao TaxID=3641 RepID=A0AB32V4V4_THECC|nr:PREDICTED: defensin-like protein 125 [Theobroma cacao]EOY09578.1 Low-molecular-weight cysteine-rich 16, putative [Theobroma cacao]WRX23229.1 Defensin-like protein - like 4 [Theobroma cacao]